MEVMMCVVCSVLAMCGRLRAVHLQAKSQRIQLDLTTVFYYYIGIGYHSGRSRTHFLFS